MGTDTETGVRSSRAGAHSSRKAWSSAFSSPWSCSTSWRRLIDAGTSGWASTVDRSSPAAFQCATASSVSSRSTRPMASSNERRPSEASSSRTSSAMYSKKVSTNSGLPLYLARSAGVWVAMPTGQVSRWQTRIMMQPETTSGAEAKPYSSAPSSAPMITSRPVLSCPSTWTTIRSRSPLASSVCWVSARPISHGMPACFNEVSGAAPVPPSWPEMSTTSEWALATPAATVPTPTSATSLTCTRAAGLDDLRSWMSWAMSSME